MSRQSNRSAPLYGIRCRRWALRPHQTGAPTRNRHQDDTRRRKRRANLCATLKCFLVASGSGAGLWAALALGTGWLLQGAVQGAISVLDQHAGGALLITAGLVASWLGWKLWQKSRFRRLADIPHITPEELIAALRSDRPPLLLDLRGATMIAETGPLPVPGTSPGAIVAEHDALLKAVGNWPRDRLIVTLCACPENAGAIQAARHLLDAGYRAARPLQGGYEAWMAVSAANAESPGEAIKP